MTRNWSLKIDSEQTRWIAQFHSFKDCLLQQPYFSFPKSSSPLVTFLSSSSQQKRLRGIRECFIDLSWVHYSFMNDFEALSLWDKKSFVRNNHFPSSLQEIPSFLCLYYSKLGAWEHNQKFRFQYILNKLLVTSCDWREIKEENKCPYLSWVEHRTSSWILEWGGEQREDAKIRGVPGWSSFFLTW